MTYYSALFFERMMTTLSEKILEFLNDDRIKTQYEIVSISVTSEGGVHGMTTAYSGIIIYRDKEDELKK